MYVSVYHFIAWNRKFDEVEQKLEKVAERTRTAFGGEPAENSRTPTSRRPDTVNVNCQQWETVQEHKPNRFGFGFDGTTTTRHGTYSVHTRKGSGRIPDGLRDL